jgi:Tfp pilus assembly protein PilN
MTRRRARGRRAGRPRAPYVRRSVWAAVAIIAVIFVVGGVIAGYQIHELQSSINQLNTQLSLLNHAIQQKAK